MLKVNIYKTSKNRTKDGKSPDGILALTLARLTTEISGVLSPTELKLGQ